MSPKHPPPQIKEWRLKDELDEILGQFVGGADGEFDEDVHVEGEAGADLAVEVGCHVQSGHLLQQELEAGSDVELGRHLVRVEQTLQQHVHLLLRQLVQKHCKHTNNNAMPTNP